MISDRDLVPVTVAAGPPAGREAVAAKLTARARTELPVLATMGEREELLAAAWLTGLRSARTRRAYAGDLAGWLAWLAPRGIDVLAAARVHVDLWASMQQGAEASTVRRRLSALSSFYRYCAAHDLIGQVPVQGVARPSTRTTPQPSAWTATRPRRCSLRLTGTRGRRRCAVAR